MLLQENIQKRTQVYKNNARDSSPVHIWPEIGTYMFQSTESTTTVGELFNCLHIHVYVADMTLTNSKNETNISYSFIIGPFGAFLTR